MKLTIADKGVKTGRSTAFAVLIGLCVTLPPLGRSPPNKVRPNVTGKTVPTTKILAVGSWTPKATADGVRPVLPSRGSRHGSPLSRRCHRPMVHPAG